MKIDAIKEPPSSAERGGLDHWVWNFIHVLRVLPDVRIFQMRLLRAACPGSVLGIREARDAGGVHGFLRGGVRVGGPEDLGHIHRGSGMHQNSFQKRNDIVRFATIAEPIQ